MLTNFKRVLKFALVDFYRSKGISIAAIFILIITILVITGLYFLHGISDFVISEVQNKIDITAYFISDASEQDILNIKNKILADSPGIKNIQYISKEEALDNFTQKHQDNSVFSNALTQVGDNPFLPSLSITTNGDAMQYQEVALILQQGEFSDLIEKVDYSQKKDIIDKIFSITSGINVFGLGFAVVLVMMVVLVVFNTIKLIIDSSKDEISTMRIVGASSWFVRAPFVIQGVIFGSISFAICFIITGLLAYFLSAPMAAVLGGFSIFRYFISNILIIIALQLGFGIGLGALSSIIVVNRYLKV